MKTIKSLVLTVAVTLLLGISTSLAQSPPPPNNGGGDAGSGNTEVGGNGGAAPIGGGLLILMALGAGYGLKKYLFKDKVKLA